MKEGLVKKASKKPDLDSKTLTKGFVQMNRLKHLTDPIDHTGLNFETRLHHLARNKISTSKLSTKVIEAWLNETLTDAGHLEIPGTLLKPGADNPMKMYKIDKFYLNSAENQISYESSERIYRALFVYSLGFYEMLNNELSHSPNKVIIQGAVWKVFSILLEYCCKTNYQMLIKKLAIEHDAALAREEDKYREFEDRMLSNENRLKTELDDVTRAYNETRRELDETLLQNKKLMDEMASNKSQYEEEVQLRL